MQTKTLTTAGTKFLLDGQPFNLRGISFFNAIYNASFHQDSETRMQWLEKFRSYGINTLRVWCQWDMTETHSFIDLHRDNAMYLDNGEIRREHFQTLTDIILQADQLAMVVEVVLFSHEKDPNLSSAARERAAKTMAERLKPFRNIILQIWNEDSRDIERLFHVVKEVDPERLVTNSPGLPGDLGDDGQNALLDILTPHTARGDMGEGDFWRAAPLQIKELLNKFQKPVIDDEPGRKDYPGGTTPEQHIEEMKAVCEAGGYPVYHHDMFVKPYGDAAVPPHGIPDPEFSSFHKKVLMYFKEASSND